MASRSALPIAIACGVVGLLSLLTLGVQAGEIAHTSFSQTAATTAGSCEDFLHTDGTRDPCGSTSPSHTTYSDSSVSSGTEQDKAVLAFAVLSFIWSPLSCFLYFRARASARLAHHLLLQAGVSGALALAILVSAIAKAADDHADGHDPSALKNAGAAFGFILGLGRIGLTALFIRLAFRARSAPPATGPDAEQGYAAKHKQAMGQSPGVPVLAYQAPTQPMYPIYQSAYHATDSPAAPTSPRSSPPFPLPPMASPVPVEAPRRPALGHGDSANSRKHSSSSRPSRSASYQTYPQHINHDAPRPAGRDRRSTANDQQIISEVARAYGKEMDRLDRILRRSGADV